jgi:DNA-binding response OmpR family regulator
MVSAMKSPELMTRRELEDEVAYLRDELRPADNGEQGRLMAALKTTAAETRILLALYAGKGRPVSNWRLSEASPPARMTADRNDIAVLKIWISRIRRKLGADAVQTVYGIGYALTPEGAARVKAALGDERAAA